MVHTHTNTSQIREIKKEVKGNQVKTHVKVVVKGNFLHFRDLLITNARSTLLVVAHNSLPNGPLSAGQRVIDGAEVLIAIIHAKKSALPIHPHFVEILAILVVKRRLGYLLNHASHAQVVVVRVKKLNPVTHPVRVDSSAEECIHFLRVSVRQFLEDVSGVRRHNVLRMASVVVKRH